MTTVKQTLFEISARDGSDVSFAVLEDEQCAILRGGIMTATFPSDELGKALKQYFKLVEQCGGARHPVEALDVPAHPYAG